MTNYEWLLQMGGEERQAWFDAEHVDANDVSTRKGDVREDDVCANDGFMDLDSCTHGVRTFASETDSRKKLEADVRKWCAMMGMQPYQLDFVYGWLDRQAAITERETKLRELHKFEENHRYHIRSIEEVNQKLNKRIAELTAERDGLKAQVNSWRERNGGNMAMVDSLAKQVNELRAERDELKEKLRIEREAVEACDGCNLVDELTAERDALADDLLTCNKEREEYRELFSEALTLAAEIVNLQP